MALLEGLTNIFKAIPIVKDIINAIDGPSPSDVMPNASGYPYNTKNVSSEGFFSKVGKGTAENLSKNRESPTIETADPSLNAAQQYGAKGKYKLSVEQIPGYTNPRFKALYDMYDLQKIMKRNLILTRNEVQRVPSPGAPIGPNIRPNRGVKYLED